MPAEDTAGSFPGDSRLATPVLFQGLGGWDGVGHQASLLIWTTPYRCGAAAESSRLRARRWALGRVVEPPLEPFSL